MVNINIITVLSSICLFISFGVFCFYLKMVSEPNESEEVNELRKQSEFFNRTCIMPENMVIISGMIMIMLCMLLMKSLGFK
jgi:hypothetical protein